MKKLLLLLSACLFMLNRIAAQTPVVHFNFNNTTNDASLGLIGTPNFTPVYVTGSPQTGSQAIRLANGNFITVPFNSALNLTSWTFSAVVRYTSPNSTTSLIIERFDPNYIQWGPDYMSVEIYQGKFAGSPANHVNNWGVPPILVAGQWYNLTITYNNTTGALTTYVNGTSVNSSTWSSPYNFTGRSPKLFIGSVPGYGLIGDIDDIKIFSGVVPPGQIGQTLRCGIYYDYDVAGCRIKRYYDCKDPSYGGDPGNGGGIGARMINLAQESPAKQVAVGIFPNPTEGKFSIRLPKSGTHTHYHIYSDLGALISSGYIDDEIKQCDISILAPGTYIVNVFYENIKYNFILTKI